MESLTYRVITEITVHIFLIIVSKAHIIRRLQFAADTNDRKTLDMKSNGGDEGEDEDEVDDEEGDQGGAKEDEEAGRQLRRRYDEKFTF